MKIKLGEAEKREIERRAKLVSVQPLMSYAECVEQVKKLRNSSGRNRPVKQPG
jgi:hypothetical protein